VWVVPRFASPGKSVPAGEWQQAGAAPDSARNGKSATRRFPRCDEPEKGSSEIVTTGA